MVRKGIRARIRPALDWPSGAHHRKVYPFRRSWIAIGVLAVFDIVFTIPAVIVFRQAVTEWGKFEDLFDLVGALFSSAWLMGWSIAPLAMTTILLLMLFGRESTTVRSRTLRVFMGLPLIGVAADYEIAHMRNLRVEHPEKNSGKSWRGTHLEFDYGANAAALGSNAGAGDLAMLKSLLERAYGEELRQGEAWPEEMEGRWDPVSRTLVAEHNESVRDAPLASVTWSSPSTLALVAANLVPVAGAVWLGWNLGDVMVLYWAESGVIGVFNVCKLIVISRWVGVFSGIFFMAHFGAFMAVHFLFIWMLFVKGLDDNTGGDLREVAHHFFTLWPALVALFASHGISFFTNFIGRREYLRRTVKQQMGEPYTRIVLMHLVIIFGGGLALVLGSATPVILLVIAGKIWFDVRAHLKQRAAAA